MNHADADIHYVVSTDNGDTWSAEARLNANPAGLTHGNFAPQITTDGAGTWIAVWQSNDPLDGAAPVIDPIGTDLDILYSTSTDNGSSWSLPAALNSNAATDKDADKPPPFHGKIKMVV